MPDSSVVVGGVALLCFPPADGVFCATAEQTFAALKAAIPAELEAALRRIYPRAVVRERERLASHEPAWYVYRDGRYSPFTSTDPWWEAPDAARTVLDDAGAYLTASPAALDLLGVSCEELLASKAGAFTVPEYQVMIPWIFELLRDTGEIHSTTMLRPRRGPDIPVEYRFLREGDGPGRHVSILRRVPAEAVGAGAAGVAAGTESRVASRVTPRGDGAGGDGSDS
jgi:PAS domain-containing protein